MSAQTIRIPVYNKFELSTAEATIVGPRIPARWCEDVTWILAIEAITGAPTEATLKAKFQAWMANWGGNPQDQVPFATGPLWTDLTSDLYPQLLPIPLPVQLANQALGAEPATPNVFLARIAGGFYHRPVFQLATVGGTTPKWKISAECVCRG
jgi:hypothetical protein